MTSKSVKKDFNLNGSLARLTELEAYFQQPELNLDEALEKHKEAVALGKEVLSYLKHAENEVIKITLPTED